MHTPHFLTTPRLSAMVLAVACCAPMAIAQSGNTKSNTGKEPVTLNFVNAEIEAVARTLATLSGHNVVVDPRVKGTMTLSSTVAVPPAQALRLFASQLRT